MTTRANCLSIQFTLAVSAPAVKSNATPFLLTIGKHSLTFHGPAASGALKVMPIERRNMEANAPVNVDAILQSILGRRAERFGMAAAVLRGERIIAQGVAGVQKRGTAERITLDDRFLLGSCT